VLFSEEEYKKFLNLIKPYLKKKLTQTLLKFLKMDLVFMEVFLDLMKLRILS